MWWPVTHDPLVPGAQEHSLRGQSGDAARVARFTWRSKVNLVLLQSYYCQSVMFLVIMAAAVVSDLTCTPCTWKNRMRLDINTGRRAARSDIPLVFIQWDFAWLFIKGEVGVGSKFNLGKDLNSDTTHRPHQLQQQRLSTRRRRGLGSVFDRMCAAVPSGGQGFGTSRRNSGNSLGRADPKGPAALCQHDRGVGPRWAGCNAQKHKGLKRFTSKESWWMFLLLGGHRYGGGFVWTGCICGKLPG